MASCRRRPRPRLRRSSGAARSRRVSSQSSSASSGRRSRASSRGSRRPGWSSATGDPADGRASLVSVTREGSELLRRIRTRKNAYLARRLSKLDPDDLARARARRGRARAPCSRTIAGDEALHRSFDSLHVPNYRRYFAGQVVSVSGNWMQMVAETWLILELTGSGVIGRPDRGRCSSCRSSCSAPTAA